MLIAQITDPHVPPPGEFAFGEIDTAAFLARAVEHLTRRPTPPDVVLVTGDLTDAAQPEAYAQLRDLLAPLAMPVFLIPGNHDERRPLIDAFPDLAGRTCDGGFIQYVIEGFPLRLIALDTLIEGRMSGVVCARRRAWLAERLAERPDQPTLLFMHHPPFPTGIAAIDMIGLAETKELGQIIRRHPMIQRVLCGHLHRPIQARFAGTLASAAPSTAQLFALYRGPHASSAYVLEPPGYQLHAYGPDTGVVSETVIVGDYKRAKPFEDEEDEVY